MIVLEPEEKFIPALVGSTHDSPEHQEAQTVYFRNFTRNKQESK